LEEARYYVLGVEQERNSTPQGALYSLCVALEINVDEYITKLVSAIDEDPTRYTTALDGTIARHFPTARSLVEDFATTSTDIDWNALFCDLTEIYFDIRVLVFDDTEGGASLQLPTRLQHTDNYLLGRRIALLIKNETTYYPIIIAEREEFYRNDEILRRHYTVADEVIGIVSDMIMQYLNEQRDEYHLDIDLHIIEQCVAEHSAYKIVEIYANRRNLCYAVILQHGRHRIYIPCSESYFNDQKHEINYGVFQRRAGASYAETARYMDVYNKYVRKISPPDARSKSGVATVYAEIEPVKWVEYKKSVIGFSSNGLNYYCDVPTTETRRLPLPTINLEYDPDQINYAMADGIAPDRNASAENRAIYQHYMYQLLLIEFIDIIESERNTALRKKLIMFVMKSDFRRKAAAANKSLERLLGDYNEDLIRIKLMINEYANNHLNKSRLVQEITEEVFDFDKCILQKLLSIRDHKALVARLQLISHKFVQVGTPKFTQTDFPNVLSACSASPAEYCKNKKLVVAKRDLDEMLDIMAYDLKNPNKQQILFSRAFVKTSLDPFRFVKRPYEQVYVAFL
jgi:hypothetical protein